MAGFDVSAYAIENAKPEVKPYLSVGRAEEPLSYTDNEFDVVVSLGTLHNLAIDGLQTALREIQRVGRNAYIMVESFRREQELFNLQCWALTCESFYRPEGWTWLFDHFGYQGDYEFIYFE